MKKISFKILHIVLIIFAFSLIFSCGGNSNDEKKLEEYKAQYAELGSKIKELENKLGKNAIEEDAYPVSVLSLKNTSFMSFIEVPGLITSKQNVQIFAEMPGNITRIYVKEGQHIRRGQLIAKQDASTISSQLGQLEANLELAKTTFDRQQRLWDQNIGSEIQFLQAKTSVETLQKQINAIKAQVAKYYIYSPVSGVVDDIFINQGESAMGPIARVINLRNIQMEAQLSENYIGKVKKGDEVTVIANSLDLELKTKISAVGQIIHPDSRTFRVEAALKNPNQILKPNMTAIMKIMLDKIDNIITIPANVIQKDGNDDFVYIADNKEDKTIALRKYLEVNNIYQGIAAINSGLNENDQLVVQGHTELSDSMYINIKNQPIE